MFEAHTEPGMTFRRVAQRIRVPAGFVLLPLLLIASRPTLRWLIPGGSLAVVGLGIRAWASGYLRKNLELTTAGPYAHTRNPLYLGTFFLGTGVALSTGALWFVAVFVAFYLLIYAPVMSAEAKTMSDLFPGEYEAYRREVPLFLPRVTPYRGRLRRQFEPSAYLRHREYRAAIGLVIIYGLIAAKHLIFR
jgi:protein-S-isoprenylcysteine O-methyltransferase Ste14